jgi:hypothetical protein
LEEARLDAKAQAIEEIEKHFPMGLMYSSGQIQTLLDSLKQKPLRSDDPDSIGAEGEWEKCTCECHALENFGFDKKSCIHCEKWKFNHKEGCVWVNDIEHVHIAPRDCYVKKGKE